MIRILKDNAYIILRRYVTLCRQLKLPNMVNNTTRVFKITRNTNINIPQTYLNAHQVKMSISFRDGGKEGLYQKYKINARYTFQIDEFQQSCHTSQTEDKIVPLLTSFFFIIRERNFVQRFHRVSLRQDGWVVGWGSGFGTEYGYQTVMLYKKEKLHYPVQRRKVKATRFPVKGLDKQRVQA